MHRIKEELNEKVFWEIRLWMVIIFIFIVIIAVIFISLAICAGRVMFLVVSAKLWHIH